MDRDSVVTDNTRGKLKAYQEGVDRNNDSRLRMMNFSPSHRHCPEIRQKNPYLVAVAAVSD